MKTTELIKMSNQNIMHTYARLPVVLVSGKGMEVFDNHHKKYKDFLGGIAVNCLGHCHEKVVKAIKKQAEALIHVSNLYHIEPQIRLAKILTENSFADKVFFCNSGAEANEAAIKLSRLYSYENYGKDRYEIITCFNSFHGRTMAALSATGQNKYQRGFAPLLPGFKFIPFNDIASLKKALTLKTCAVMVEPIQGEAGVIIPEKGYLEEVGRFCSENNLLLIFDEVQTGIGRTGELFAYDFFGVKPDIMTLAKALGGGMAIGALLATEKIASSFKGGSHASTFGGNPLACASALATMETLIENDSSIIKNCKKMGIYFKNALEKLKNEFPGIIKEVRGVGLMLALELSVECHSIVHECLLEGILISCAAEKVLRFLPPLIVTELDIDMLLQILRKILKKMGNQD